MKILHITNMYPTEARPHFGIFIKKQIESLRQSNIRLRCIGKDFGGYSKIFFIKKDVLWADIIHCHFGHTGSLALFWKFFKHKPLIVSYCGSDLLGSVKHNSYNLKSKFISNMNSFFSKYIDCAIVKSGELARIVRAKRIELIPNGVDLNIFKEIDTKSAKEKIGLTNPEEKIILFLGQTKTAVKNFPLFQESLRYLDFKFKYLVLENIPYNDVVYFMNAADVCVLTSLHEGSPNVIKETMACNRPIVSVDVGDVRELLADISGCFVVKHNPEEIADAIKKALDFKSTNSRQRILDLGLDLDSTSEKIINIYKSILAAN